MNSDAPTSEGLPTNSAVLVEIRRLIGEVIGEEYIVGIDIERDTTFGDDLEGIGEQVAGVDHASLDLAGNQCIGRALRQRRRTHHGRNE